MSGLGYLGILFQGVVIAFTVFLGRVYVLAYYETLGVPVSESQFSTIDYAIVSPSVAVVGIGLSLVLGSIFLLVGRLVSLQFPKWYKFGLPLFFIVVGLVSLIVLPIFSTDSVIRSLGIVLSTAMTSYGGVFGGLMLGSAKTAKSKRGDLEPKQMLERMGILKLFMGVLAVAIIVMHGIYAYRFSVSIARDEATNALEQSPQATVQFISGRSGNFRVVMVGEHFVYLLPKESEELQAFPLNRIEQFDYTDSS